MTLLLTCVTPRFAVQASDRRLTLWGGGVGEELANKATMLCRHATFAYTGLAQCSVSERTDEILLRCLAEPSPINVLLARLAKDAAEGIRNLPLQGVAADQRRVARRTSFVGAGFLGLKNPRQFGRPQSADELHPFLAVISNAQDLREEWRPQADQQFSVKTGYLYEGEPFLLHAAGQPFGGTDRVILYRTIRRSLDRISQPQSIARLLARAIRAVAARNSYVGPNVMCTMVRRDKALTPANTFTGGLIPIIPEVQVEAQYFKWPRSGDSPQWIYSPGDPLALRHYGPNYACDGDQTTGIELGVFPGAH